MARYCSVDDIGAVHIFSGIKVIKVTPCMSNGMETRHDDRHNSYYGDYQDVIREG